MTDSLRNIMESSQDDEGIILDILAEAFDPDPVFHYIFGDENDPRFAFTPMVPAYQELDCCFINEEQSGVALCLPPNKKEKIKGGLFFALLFLKRFGLASFIRSIKMMLLLNKHHPKFPHYYLMALGTTNAARGKGVGSALVKNLLRICDEENMPAYLENSNPDNLKFYQSHGFEVIEKITVGKGGPPMWTMIRKKKAEK